VTIAGSEADHLMVDENVYVVIIHAREKYETIIFII